ncbi:MotA/TolQ/ExbB proton channel family protein [Aquirhabdus parva]|uniref:Biopolymer transport protein ExbB n=1 Tax=Aquirhabdus parva TaxID=2283318 RepID=A0A345P2M6_9GAMM|nr:MotA/TolQ/ExbB proton channel family protein [Aquirhabdus parva]
MSFIDFWTHADFLSKSLSFVLLIMSIATWTIVILRVLATRQATASSAKELNQSIAELAIRSANLSTENRRDVAEQVLLQQLARTRNDVERGVSILGTIASVSPFVGLFGTVWGIFHALAAIGQSGQAGLAQVAGPVGEALIMTGMGLAVAIPAVLAYNLCVRLNRVLLNKLHDQAHSLLVEELLTLSPAQVKPQLGGQV